VERLDAAPLDSAEWEPDTDPDAQPWATREPAALPAALASAPAPPELSPEPGDLGLLEMMRTGAHSAAISTIEHVKSGAYVAARTGVALTPATFAFIVIFAGGLLGGGVCAARLAGKTYLYLRDDTPLLVDATAHSLPLAGGPLPRGTRLTRLGVAGHFSRVTDPLGRTGYVHTAALLGAQPLLDSKPLVRASTMAPASVPATAPATAPAVAAAAPTGEAGREHPARAAEPGPTAAPQPHPPAPSIAESPSTRASKASAKARSGKARRRGAARRAPHL
jgi:hypothetical protein